MHFFKDLFGCATRSGPCTFDDSHVGVSISVPDGWTGKLGRAPIVASFQHASKEICVNIQANRMGSLPADIARFDFHVLAREYVRQIREDVGNAPSYQGERETDYLSSINCNDGSTMSAFTVEYEFKKKTNRKVITFAKRGRDWGYELLITIAPAANSADYDQLVKSIIVNAYR